MPGSIVFREPDDPSRGRQLPCESLVMRGPGEFALIARLPSGERIDVPLGGHARLDIRLDRPPDQPNE